MALSLADSKVQAGFLLRLFDKSLELMGRAWVRQVNCVLVCRDEYSFYILKLFILYWSLAD